MMLHDVIDHSHTFHDSGIPFEISLVRCWEAISVMCGGLTLAVLFCVGVQGWSAGEWGGATAQVASWRVTEGASTCNFARLSLDNSFGDRLSHQALSPTSGTDIVKTHHAAGWVLIELSMHI